MGRSGLLNGCGHARKVRVGDVGQHQADGVGGMTGQTPGSGVGHIAHFAGQVANPLRRFRPDIRHAVERLADRGHRAAAARGNFL